MGTALWRFFIGMWKMAPMIFGFLFLTEECLFFHLPYLEYSQKYSYELIYSSAVYFAENTFVCGIYPEGYCWFGLSPMVNSLFLQANLHFIMEEKRRTVSKPDWLKIKLPNTADYNWMNKVIRDNKLHTICTSGKCPNAAECWRNGTATFMILGDVCTRSCKFCNVTTGRPLAVDVTEPMRIARSIQIMKLKHAVITSVDRDDLEDGGAGIWVETIGKVKERNPDTTLEVLIPDFNGSEVLLQKVIDAKPEVISHNIETVRRLTEGIRSKARYDLSLEVLHYISNAGVVAKSGLMLGLGEKEEEVFQAMEDLIHSGVQVLTIGQYLQPSAKQLPVKSYVTPEVFAKYKEEGLKRGFSFVESAPLVRSSYHAENHINALALKGKRVQELKNLKK